MTKTVLVVFGGQSPEHPVSIVTAVGVLNALDTDHYTPIPVGINQQGTGSWPANTSRLTPHGRWPH